ncbi:MAG: tRNA epoxyqueuosine(34) reductase QueG [Gammaproteobacteria bacterium]|nr:tRNA epoxyqueuosine(34) reductase QueG [Gammaproteobacteria bacterium]
MSDSTNRNSPLSPEQILELVRKIKHWASELGFQQTGITDTDLSAAAPRLLSWLDKNYHAEMAWMNNQADMRIHPQKLVEGTRRIISVRMDYLPSSHQSSEEVLNNPSLGYISRYALGRDYHKLMRRRLQKLADLIKDEVGAFGYRAFVDSAPVQEKALAEKAGLGWAGKHSNIINQNAGSWFFLGELFTDLPLPVDPPAQNHCGNCRTCIDICPTQAIVEPYVVDARLCISYLTIEHPGSIPVELRPMLGNRIYGCDDCQLCCPWNRFAVTTREADYFPRHKLDAEKLSELFLWDEQTFLKNTEGSAIRRIGHERWQRNIAVALGNAPAENNLINLLKNNSSHSERVQEHISWAIRQQTEKLADTP